MKFHLFGVRIYVPDNKLLDVAALSYKDNGEMEKNKLIRACYSNASPASTGLVTVNCAPEDGRKPGAKSGHRSDCRYQTLPSFTRCKANAAIYDELDFDDKDEEYGIRHPWTDPTPETPGTKGRGWEDLLSQEAYAFLDDYEKAPDSVNPSLWRTRK